MCILSLEPLCHISRFEAENCAISHAEHFFAEIRFDSTDPIGGDIRFGDLPRDFTRKFFLKILPFESI